VTKPYRGFESLSLRHQVSTAEKFRSLCAEICETCPYFAIIHTQTGLERTDCLLSIGLNVSPFLWTAEWAVRFQANAMRSQSRKNRQILSISTRGRTLPKLYRWGLDRIMRRSLMLLLHHAGTVRPDVARACALVRGSAPGAPATRSSSRIHRPATVSALAYRNRRKAG